MVPYRFVVSFRICTRLVYPDVVTKVEWCAPGTIAHCGGPDPSRRCPFVRLSYSTAAIPQLEVGISRLAEVLKKVSQKHSHVQEEADTKITTATTMF